MEALARDGIVFDSAYCASPLCAPSRASFMAGLLPSRTRVYDNAAEFGADIPTFAHGLRARGYRTILSGKMHFCGPDQLHGFEQRLTTDIYPADFNWTPDWDRPEHRPSWYHNMSSVPRRGLVRALEPARLRRRSRLHGGAGDLRHRAVARSAAVPHGRLVLPSARPVRRASALLGSLPRRGHRHAGAGRRARSAFAPPAPRLRDGRGARDGSASARRPSRLLRRDRLCRRPHRPAHGRAARGGAGGGHDRHPHQRSRRDAGRTRPLVQDELPRGLMPRAPRHREPRTLRAASRQGERLACRSHADARRAFGREHAIARRSPRMDAASRPICAARRATTRRSANIWPKGRSRRS